MIVLKLRGGCCCLRQLTFCNCAERSLRHPLFLCGDPSLSLCISRAVTRLLKWESQYRATLITWHTEDAASRLSGGEALEDTGVGEVESRAMYIKHDTIASGTTLQNGHEKFL